MKRCCDLSGITFIEVAGRRVGLLGFGEALGEVRSLGLTSDEEIAKALLSRVGRRNYIPDEAQGAYAQALLAEYRRR